MQLTFKFKVIERGCIELILLTFLAIFLIQINSLWTLSKLKLAQEKISAEVIKEDSDKKGNLYTLLKSDPLLISIPASNTGLKTVLKSPYSNTTFSLPDRAASLNWLFFDSLNIGGLHCNDHQHTPDFLCNLNSYTFTSSKLAPFTETIIKELIINADIEHPALMSLGNLSIESLVLNSTQTAKYTYLLLSSYNNMRIDKISGSVPAKTKLLLYSVLGEIKIIDSGLNKPCDSSGNGPIVFLGPAINLEGENRDDLRFSNKTCLKDFPNEIFTSIKIASIH